MHYFEIYDRHFSRFENKPITVMEIGIWEGGSLQMWKHCFGPKARIIGVDIQPELAFSEPQIEVVIGDAGDRNVLHNLKQGIGKIDVLIDDGSHKLKDQVAVFEELFPAISENGIYLCEDLHTSYWPEGEGNFVDYLKEKVDSLNAWHDESLAGRIFGSAKVNFALKVKSITFYDSVCVIERGKNKIPTHRKTGSIHHTPIGSPMPTPKDL